MTVTSFSFVSATAIIQARRVHRVRQLPCRFNSKRTVSLISSPCSAASVLIVALNLLERFKRFAYITVITFLLFSLTA
ncbi:MAG TPA: hypothetical protein DEF07_04020 [Nitrosomonas sp.]|nr:hypothetical protein [Nitrosomonas sp.]